MAWPHSASVIPGLGLPLSHSDHSPCRQYQHCPQAMKETTTTRSPTWCFVTPDPTSATVPMNLVPEHVPRAHGGDVAAHQVQVGTAGGAEPHLDDDVVVVEDAGLGDVLDADLVDPAPGHRLHRTPAFGATLVHASRSTPPGVAVRSPCGAGSTARTSPTSMSCLARRSANRRSACGSLPLIRLTAPDDGRSRSRAASSVPLPPGAGRTRTSIRSPYSASGAGS